MMLIFALLYALNVGLIEVAIYSPHTPSEVGHVLAPLAYVTQNIELSYPTLSHIAAIALILAGAIVVMMTAIRENLYGTTTHLPAIIYIGLFAAFSTPDDLLAPPLAALLMAMSIGELYASYGALNLSHRLFNGLFLIGVLPLIYPAAMTLSLLIFVVLFLFERIGREAIVILVAYFMPLAMALYLGWLMGEGFGQQIELFKEALMDSLGGVRGSLNALILYAVMLFVGVYVVRNIDELSISLMSRKRTFYAVVAFLLSLGMMLFPCFTLQQLLIASAPIAIFSITAVALTPMRWASRLYALYLLLIVACRFIPI